jgi:autotransporter-associated beta strand protein
MALSLKAAPFTWTGLGADNNWQTGGNWDPGTPASDGTATLTFSGDKRTGAVNDFPADTVFAGITFANDFSTGKIVAFTNSGARIILGGNISTASPTVDGTITDVISLPMLLDGTRSFTIQGNNARIHNLIVTGAIGETSGGPYGITKTGGADLTLSGANTYSGKTVITAGRVWINSLTNINSTASSLGNPLNATDGTIDIFGRLTYTGVVSTASDRILRLTGGTTTFENLSPTANSVVILTGGITNSGAGTYGLTLRGNRNITVPSHIGLGGGTLGRTDGGTLILSNPNNVFGDMGISDGTISVNAVSDKNVPSPIGTGKLITLGQMNGNTTGRLLFTGATGGSCDRDIRVQTQLGVDRGGTLENSVAGQTLFLSGNVYRSSSSTGYAVLQLAGVGNGVLSGNISSNLCLIKAGTGTWTLSGNNTCVGSNLVNTGLLLVNGTTASTSPFTVAAAGTLGGTGTIYSAVTSSGTLSPADTNIGTLTIANLTLNSGKLTNDLDSVAGISDGIAVTNLLTLNGANVLTLRFPNGAAPGGTYTLMTYASKTGTGTLALDKLYANTFLTVGETAVTVTISDVLTWTGSESGAWDTTAANWSPTDYSDGKAVLFDDTGANTTSVTIPTPVAPSFITVNADTKAYAIGGAGIIGTASLTKIGTNVLTLASTNTYTGATTINAGTLTLSGSISNSAIIVATNAVFTQSAGSTIGGDTVEFTCQGLGTMNSANTYGGLTTIGLVGTPGRKLTVNHNNALGSTAAGTIVNGGNASFNQETWLVLGNGVVITGEALTLNGIANNRATLWQASGSGSSATWDGNIEIVGAAYIKCESSGATLRIGASSEDTITGSGTLNLRGNGTNIINSTISIGASPLYRDDVGTAIINSTGNTWGETSALQGTLRLGVSGALPASTFLFLGKSGNTSTAIFDLNGYDQTVSRLVDQHFSGGFQRITSALPATLIVSNTVDSAFNKEGSVIDGQVSLVKANTGTLTLATTNAFSGSFTLLGGTNVITATGTLGINCTNVTVVAGTLKLQATDGISDAAVVMIADGGAAKIELEGVEETVKWLYFGEKPKLPGRYSATAGSGIIVDTEHFSGTGVLKVLRGPSATLIMFK